MKRSTTLFFVLTTVLCLILTISSYSQINEKDVKNNLPKMLGANNVGKDFWFTIPPCYEDVPGVNFVKIFVTSAVQTLVTCEIPGKGYYRQQQSVANDIIQFVITPTIGQPYTKNGTDPEVPDDIFKGAGIHVSANAPIVVYGMVRYHTTSDGWLCIPVASLGNEYIIAGYTVDPMFRKFWGLVFPNTTGIVAAFDNTKVKFTMGGNVGSVTAGGLTPGQTREVLLMKGDVFMVSTKGDGSDLSGSHVVASKPVGVVTGNQCADIPIGNQWCDYTAEMDLPTFVWGTDYHIPMIPYRRWCSIIRIFAKLPNTKIYRDGNQVGFLTDASGIQEKAFVETRVNPNTMDPGVAIYSGDKPIGVTLYNTGTEEDGYGATSSDPFVMVISPIQQYQTDITFCTPGINGDPGFAFNYIDLVYPTDKNGLMTDDFEYGSVVGGKVSWYKLKSKFPGNDYLYNTKYNGVSYAMKRISLPGDGVYKIRSVNHPFAAYSFGFDDYDSYGYPTSAALADLEKPDSIPPVPTWVENCDGSVNNGIITDKPDDIFSRSNMSSIMLDPILSSNYELTYDDFIPGSAFSVKWYLNVIDPTKDATAVIIFADRRGNDTIVTINYNAVKMFVTPDSVDYGKIKINSAFVEKDFWIHNGSNKGPLTIDTIKVKKGNQHFEVDLSSVNLPYTLAPGDSLHFLVKFDPTEAGSFRDSIGVADTCILFYLAEVKAAVGDPVIHVNPVDFLTVSLSSPPVTNSFQIINNGNLDLLVYGYTGPSLPYFSPDLPALVNNKFASPLVIHPKQAKVYSVTFTPSQTGLFIDSLVFSSNANTTDSICILKANVIVPGLTARGFDWGNRRIDRPNFPIAPYTVDTPYKAIYLKNDGTQAVYVSDFKEITNDNGSVFEFDRTSIKNGFKIQAGADTVIPVLFHPVAVGPDTLILNIVNDANTTTNIRLTGTGILPRLQTDSIIDFGSTYVKDPANIQTRTVTFRNINYTYSDSVQIMAFSVAPNGSIKQNLTSYGNLGFQYNNNTLNLPVWLQPGDSISFNANFIAQKIGQVKASLTTVSDADSDVTSTWTGSGFTQSFSVTGDSSSIYICDKGTIVVTITNTGSGDIIFNSLYFHPDNGNLLYKDPNDAKGFTIKSGDTKKVFLYFVPNTVVSDEIVYLMLPNSTLTDPLDSVKIVLSAKYHNSSTQVNILTPNTLKPWPSIGDTIFCRVVLNNSDDLTIPDIKNLHINLKYNAGILQLIPGYLQIGLLIKNDFSITSSKDSMGVLDVELTANQGKFLNGNGDLLYLGFTTFLPTEKDSLARDTARFIAKLTSTNQCVVIANDTLGSSVELKPTCAYNLRWISVSKTAYDFSQINPNPVKSNYVDLNFSVGLDGFTQLSIYNTQGELVALPVSSNLRSGNYSVNVPLAELSSGIYYCKLISGSFSLTRYMVIVK